MQSIEYALYFSVTKLPATFAPAKKNWIIKMKNKIILLTGASSGIGKETAKALARQGHTVMVHGRDKARTQAVCNEIKLETGNTKVDMVLADLLSLPDVKRMAGEVARRYDRLDVLINNAGALFGKERETTKEGFEKTMALNLLAPFLLTELLLDLLAKSPAARIVNVVSEMHKRGGKPDFSDFRLEKSYSTIRAYGLSKLYNIWMSRHLVSELKQKGIHNITVNTLHPGMIATKFGQDSDKGFFNNLVFKLATPFMITPAQGAATSIYAATSAEVENVTGQYFKDKRVARADDTYYSAENAQTVWDYCMQVTEPYRIPASVREA